MKTRESNIQYCNSKLYGNRFNECNLFIIQLLVVFKLSGIICLFEQIAGHLTNQGRNAL
jgi:hypothetical protein